MSLGQIFSILFDTPWKVWNEACRLISLPGIRLYFAWHGIAWGKGWKIYGFPIIQKHRRSTIQFGDYLELRSTPESNPLSPFHPVIISTREPNSSIEAGSHFSMTGGSLVAAQKITIGEYVTVGANSVIIDTDFHPLDPKMRRSNPTQTTPQPVKINDDVFIGTQSIILKGVSLGAGSIIGAGSVVTTSVPKSSLAVGSPASVVKSY